MREGLFPTAEETAGLSPGSLLFPETTAGTAELFLFDDKTLDKTRISAADWAAGSPPERSFWLRLRGLPGPDWAAALTARHGLSALLLEDLLNKTHTAKIEDFDDGVFLLLKDIDLAADADRIAIAQLGVFVVPGGIISVEANPKLDRLSTLEQRLEKGGRLRTHGPGYAAYALIDLVVDNYLVVLERLGDRFLELEEAQLEGFQAANLAAIHSYRRELTLLRKAVRPLRELVGSLRVNGSELFGEHLDPYLRDLRDHTFEVNETLDTYRELLLGLLDLHLSQAGQRMNEIMKVLTVIATLFIPLTFIAGIYGMNFEFMPELHWRWGYAAVWGLMLACAAGMVVYFRRKNWF